MVTEATLALSPLPNTLSGLLFRSYTGAQATPLGHFFRRRRPHQFFVGSGLTAAVPPDCCRSAIAASLLADTHGGSPPPRRRTSPSRKTNAGCLARDSVLLHSLCADKSGRPTAYYPRRQLTLDSPKGFLSPGRRGFLFFLPNTPVGLDTESLYSGFPLIWYSMPNCFGCPWSLESTRGFGGRAGGLKRRKPRRDPGVVIQSGLGRRQEFFWPEKSRRTRVPLYQNSRPNLIYDQRFKRFMCMWYSNGVQVFRPFSCRGRKGGRGKEGLPDGLGIGRNSGTWERARAKAIVLLKQLKRQGRLNSLAKPDVARSGVRGVYFDTEEKLWVATWNEHGLRRFKAFPTMEMGFDAAYQAAVALRRQKLQENYVFCMQRNRKKSGRPPLK